MSLVQTIASSSAPVSISSIMTSQPPATANTATGSSQTYLLGSLQSSTSSNSPITPSKARKQAQAQRGRLVALSNHLKARLQYANFKVEHGWSKQSLSEVENLYYRQNQSGTSSASTATHAAATGARKSASTSPNNSGSKAPVTPSVAATQAHAGVGSRLFKDAAVKKIDVEGGDVFGGYGLATPPASAGSVPGATSYLTSKRGRSTSSTPISPPNTSNASSATKSAEHGSATKRSPNSINNTGSRSSHGATTSAASGGATSYADFWSRVGSSTASTTGAANTATSRPSSPSKKRSADEAAANQAGSPNEGNAVATSRAAASTSASSPHKRVRMESDADRASTTTSPAKAALAERGPSFAASSIRRS